MDGAMDDLDGRRWVWGAVALGVAAVLCVCFGAAGLAVYQAGGPTRLAAARLTPTPTPPRPTPQPTATVDRLQPTGTPLLTRGSGRVQVSGLVRNSEPVARSAVLTATLYDGGGRVLGTAVGAVLNVPPNDTKPYTLYSEVTAETVARAQVAVASRLPTSPLPGEAAITFASPTARAVASGFQIEARASNSDRVAHRFTAVGALLDGAGNLVGLARGAASVPAGGTVTVTLISVERLPPYQSIRVQVDVLEE
jgi:hypothetical protein